MELTPEKLRDQLIAALTARQPSVAKFDRYFKGDHDMPVVQEKVKEQLRRKGRWADFLRLLKSSRGNFMEIVVEAVSQRTAVDGFRFTDPNSPADDDPTRVNLAWQIWQGNGLDARQKLLIRDALVTGYSYALVWPSSDLASGVRITIEHASQCITRCDPETGDAVVGLKSWCVDDVDYVTLYTLDLIYKWSRSTKDRTSAGKWIVRQPADESWPLANPIAGVLALVECCPRPETTGGGRSELDGLIDTQDRINAMLFGRVSAAWGNATRQRHVSGLELEVDEETKLPLEPFETALDSMLYSTNKDTRWGEFSALDLTQLIAGCESDLRILSSQSSTPYQLLMSGGNGLNGDSWKAHLSSLIAKVRDRQLFIGEAIEQIMRVALLAIGNPAGTDQATEVEWMDPEYRTEGELVDALVKMRTLGVPLEVLWRRWGASPQEVNRWQALRLTESLTANDPVPAVSVQSPFQQEPVSAAVG